MKFSTRIDFSASRNSLDLERARRVREGLPIIDLSQSNPTKTGLFFPPEILAGALGARANSSYRPDPRGLTEARLAIASVLAAERKPGTAASAIDPAHLLLCASTSEAYSYLFKLLCDPGDAVLVPRPGYPLFDHLAALESVRAIGYRLDYRHPAGWSIDLEALKDSLERQEAELASGRRIKAIVLINPNNPTGSYIHEKEAAALIELCRRHDLALIADEVFHGYAVEPKADRVSFLGLEEVPTFTLDGFSKRLCLPQAKLGWIHASGPSGTVESSMGALEIISDTFLSAGTPVMNAAGALLAEGPTITAQVLSRMRDVLSVYRGILEGKDSPHRILACEGGWTALVQSPAYEREESLALDLLREEGIFVYPGYFFDMEREAHFAFSLILEPQEAEKAASRYRAFFDRYK
jgi:aspartate/methionine/tyrosine aminotransferase